MKFTQAVVVHRPAFFFTFANKLIISRRYKFKFIDGTRNENNRAIIDFQRMNEQNNSSI